MDSSARTPPSWPPGQQPPLSDLVLWIKLQFDQIDEALAAIKEQNDTMLALLQGSPNTNVIPELEAAIRRVSARATSIDQKVPDQR